MRKEDIKLILKKNLNLKKIYIKGEDEQHFQIIVISEVFEGMSIVKRHQMIYNPLKEYISKNFIHAISIKAYSILEWKSCNT